MGEMLTLVWRAVRPVTGQQRFLWWCGTLMLASGAAHLLVAAVDGAPWQGAVSWRKPATFGMSFGVLAWSAVWVARNLPERRWGWLPAGMLGGGSVVEVVSITMQRWRGEPSHFNAATTFDAAVWAVMGQVVLLVALAVAVYLVWALLRFTGEPAAGIAVVAGLLGILVSGYIGFGMAAEGEAVVEATGRVPAGAGFGNAGSAKLAHAVGMHGLQTLGLLAIGLGMRPAAVRTQVALMAVAVAGHLSVFAAVSSIAYAGRSWTSPTVPEALLAAAGSTALLVVAAAVVRGLPRAARRHADVVK